jgi:hypothetical protein
VNSITKDRIEDLTTKIDELIVIIKGKEEIEINAMTHAKVDEVYFLARNFNPAWKSQNYGSSYQNTYPNTTCVSNNFNNGGNSGNHQ